ncbi:putative ACR, YggU family [uncultured archaeon]|nr:putative ACR, YggU family [uncultured archaeon]
MRINIRVTAGARKEEVREGDPVIVKVTVQPEKGKANKRVLELLSDHYGKKAALVSGAASRNKVVDII